MSSWTPDPDFAIDTPRLVISHILSNVPEHCQCVVETHTSPINLANLAAADPSGSLLERNVDTLEKARAQIEGRNRAIHAVDGYGTFLVSEKSGRSVGVVSLIRTRPECDPQTLLPFPDIGFFFTESGQGKGYATEAACALLQYARGHWGVTDVIGITSPSNVQSKHVLGKLGLVDKGVMTLKMVGKETAVYAPPELDLREYCVDKVRQIQALRLSVY